MRFQVQEKTDRCIYLDLRVPGQALDFLRRKAVLVDHDSGINPDLPVILSTDTEIKWNESKSISLFGLYHEGQAKGQLKRPDQVVVFDVAPSPS